MSKSKFLLFFFSSFLSACQSNLTQDTLVSQNNEPFTFKITPGKARSPSSMMPSGFGPIKGPSTRPLGQENSFTKDLGRCRDHLLNQQVHFELNF